MNANQRKALLKREINQAHELINHESDMAVIKAKNIVKEKYLTGDYMKQIQEVVNGFTERTTGDRLLVDHFTDIFSTDNKITEIVEKLVDDMQEMPEEIFSVYSDLIDNENYIALTIDMVTEKLNGIATLRQVQKEFAKMADSVDDRMNEQIRESASEIVDDLNNKLYEIVGGFGYEYDRMMDLLDERLSELEFDDDDTELVKITDRREIEKMVKEKGYTYKSQKGSHRKYENENGQCIIIPFHNSKDIDRGLAYEIQRQMRDC